MIFRNCREKWRFVLLRNIVNFESKDTINCALSWFWRYLKPTVDDIYVARCLSILVHPFFFFPHSWKVLSELRHAQITLVELTFDLIYNIIPDLSLKSPLFSKQIQYRYTDIHKQNIWRMLYMFHTSTVAFFMFFLIKTILNLLRIHTLFSKIYIICHQQRIH